MDRYEEALERAKKNYRTAQDLCDGSLIGVECFKNTLTSIFPELKESDDEKVRKAIVELVLQSSEILGSNNQSRMLAWLEKQGKETSGEPSKDETDYCFTKMMDDVRRRSTIQVLEYARSLDTYNQYGKVDIDKNIAWLENQVEYKTTWKPTIEQINALTHFVRSVGESGYASPYDNNTKLLYSLLHDLEQLEKQGEQNYEFHGIAESRPAKGKLKELCQELSQSKVTKISDQDWSEEDERNLKGIIDEIETNKNDAPDCDLATYDRFLFWLKSLKQRMQ